jgi:hypothetical protein
VFTVKELQRLASTLKPDRFAKELGPFVLIQRPPQDAKNKDSTDKMGLPFNAAQTSMARPEAVSTGTLALLFQWETLVVATLPPMGDGSELTVGRQPDCDLVIDDPSVSKFHATLKWDPQNRRTTIEDKGSTNGTFLNAAIRLRRESILKDGDIVSFGEVQYWYLLTSTLYAKLYTEKLTSRHRGV